MTGRDPGEHRAATPLELLYDLTFVVSFSVAGGLFSHSIVTGHLWNGLAAFAFAMFAILWAWLSYSWFASAYDTDDWGMRLGTAVQMIGVLVLALGLPDLFHGMDQWHLDNQVVVAGYVIMRLSMVALWLRAARSDLERRPALLRYAALLVAAQIGWTLLAVLDLDLAVTVPLMAGLYVVEMGGVRLIEGRRTLTPWHPHHIAERYGLLMIITLGEVVLGTTVAVQAVLEHTGWSVDAALIAFAGVAIAVGLWWNYFAIPFGDVLQIRPDRGWVFGWGHLPLYAATAAIGVGLHVAAFYVEGESTLGEGPTVLAAALPMTAFMAVFFGLAHLLLPGRDRFHFVLLALMLIALGAAVAMGYSELPLGLSLLVLALTPWIGVVGYETRGHGHLARAMARLHEEATTTRDVS